MMDWENLHHRARHNFQMLSDELFRLYLTGAAPHWFKPFEGYRSPTRQWTFFNLGTSKAKAWQSPHQYGLAVDFVPYVVRAAVKPEDYDTAVGTWKWPPKNDPSWDWFDNVVHRSGLLRPISWDRPHVEHPLWQEIKSRVG